MRAQQVATAGKQQVGAAGELQAYSTRAQELAPQGKEQVCSTPIACCFHQQGGSRQAQQVLSPGSFIE